jgi:hypothetical protein
MKITYSLVFIIFITACHNIKSNETNLVKPSKTNEISINKTIDHSLDTILINNKLEFHISVRDIDTDFALLSASYNNKAVLSDTIDSQGLAYFKFPDFDLDGNSDILFDYFGNNSTYFLYLFDSTSNSFKSIKGYMKFPDALHLKSNPDYYYSYNRAGCADMNWESDLFQIIDFQIIHLANIYGQGCDADLKENPQIIQIFKIQNDEATKKLMEQLPYLDYIPKFDDKWEFIEKYWNKNYEKFKRDNR